ncbi:hypothetical protein V1502_17130 [Bacillus sp. SCS-153A]|uniref:hypothetical protein n=1 Tax=Rossellomorea sedimentorum TaxID=3115294 RepID=UPI0039062EA5
MDDKMLEKRMKLLNKSYERMPVQTDVSQVIKAIESERTPKKQKRRFIHWPYAASIFGALLVAAVLLLQHTGQEGASVQNAQHSEKGVTDEQKSQVINEIQSHYNVRRIQAAGSLGMSEEGFRQTEMESDAEAYVSYIIQRIESGKAATLNLTDTINEDLDNILKTPQQMIDGLKGKKLAEEEADQWVKNYTDRHEDLLPIYEAELEKYRGEWRTDSYDGQLEGRTILLERDKYSDELVTLVEGATANGIHLKYSSTDSHFLAGMDSTYVSTMLSNSEIPEAYLDVLRIKSLPSSYNGGIITTSWTRAGGDLLLYERVMKNLPDSSDFLREFELEYNNLFRAFIKGSSAQSLFTDQGALKAEIKESYEKLMEKYPDSLTVKRMEPYYNKLKGNQFIKPEGWDEFNIEYEL